MGTSTCYQLLGCLSIRRAWQLDCKRSITNRADIVSAGLSCNPTAKVGEQSNNQTAHLSYLHSTKLLILSARLDVDQTENTHSTCSASQPCIKPRQRESTLIKVRQHLRNMQHVAASFQIQTACFCIGPY
ncbi:hypothetical protein T265_09858 [Opisthorchis viverrini]|uniref:Uncharacterized protein n=1 Tax=Opisthorchis viverrini TaxID=6198 RepID=A0A074Z8L8_OPIVI|nr:hypothetical protein T265_09858 [Opisthorchis viverrini]KER21927.1 hypothetical protein T265_09858 [Opisthorchis viverrini]